MIVIIISSSSSSGVTIIISIIIIIMIIVIILRAMAERDGAPCLPLLCIYLSKVWDTYIDT